MSTNVCVIRSRPDLEHVIPNIVYGIESKKGLPESYLPDKKQVAIEMLVEKLEELEVEGEDSNPEETVHQLSQFAVENGYLFTDLIRNIKDGSGNAVPMPALDESMSSENQDHYFRASRDILQPLRSFRLKKATTQQTEESVQSRRLQRSLRKRTKTRSLFQSPLNRKYGSLATGGTHRDSRTIAFQPWKPQPNAQAYVHSLPESVKSTYGILYCGGSGKLEKRLLEVADEYLIETHTESFKW